MDPEEIARQVAQARANNYSDDEIKARFKSVGVDWAPTSAPEKPSLIKKLAQFDQNLGRSAVSGATFNFADEIIGKLPSWMGGGEKAKEAYKSQEESFKSDHPIAATAAEMVGGMAVPGFGAVKTFGKGAQTVGRAAKIGMGVGATAGGLSGAGAAEGGLVDRAKAAVAPALVGGALGGVLPAAIAGGRVAFGPVTRAGRKMNSYIQRSGGPEALLKRGQEFGAAGRGKDVMLGDISLPLQQATDFAANSSENAAEDIARVAYPRQANMANRVLDDVTAQTGNPHADKILKDLSTDTAEWADGPAGYGGLRQKNPVILPQNGQRFATFLNSPKVKEAWQQAREVGLIGEMPKAGPVSFEVMQGTKERLDFAVKKAFASPGGGDLGSRLASARDHLVEEMSTVVPGYKKVASEYARRKSLERMVETGQKLFDQEDTRGLSDFVKSLSQDELERVRQGMASEMISGLRNVKTNTSVANRQVNASSAMQDKLNIIFGSSKKAEAFIAHMKIEQEMGKVMGALGGSATARRLAAQATGIDPATLALDVAKMPVAPWSGASQAAGTVQGAIMRKLSKQTADRLGPMLSKQGLPEIEKFLRNWKAPTVARGHAIGRIPIGAGIFGENAYRGLLGDE